MRHLFWIPCVVVTLAAPGAVVHAGPYQFEFLAERPRQTNALIGGVRRLPALNDQGTVALSLPRIGPNNRDEIIYTGTPGDVRAVDTQGLFNLGAVSINNSGRIGFLGGPPSGGISIYAVKYGSAPVRISDPVLLLDRFETAISDSGTVSTVTDYYMFVASTVVAGDGTAPATTIFRTHNPLPGFGIYSTTLIRPRMSATGDWVATEFGQMAGLGYTAIHSNYGSIYSEGPPTAPGTPWLALGSADVASNGVEVFVGRHMNDMTTKIYRSQAGGETVALPGSDGLGGIVAVNDAGTIALLSGGSPEESGTLLQLFRNGSLETVLSAGDPLLGSTVSGIGFDPKGFNNAGQFAFLVGLADGRDVYVLASPVPEPAAAAVAGAVVGLMSLHRPRRRSA